MGRKNKSIKAHSAHNSAVTVSMRTLFKLSNAHRKYFGENGVLKRFVAEAVSMDGCFIFVFSP